MLKSVLNITKTVLWLITRWYSQKKLIRHLPDLLLSCTFLMPYTTQWNLIKLPVQTAAFMHLTCKYKTIYSHIVKTDKLFTVVPLHTDTSLIRTVSYVPTKFSYISSKKPLWYGPSLKRTTDTKSRPSGEQICTNLTSLLQTLPGPGVNNLGAVIRFVPKFVCSPCNWEVQ